MNENEKKNGWLSILGYVALIVVLFIGIKVVFAGLGRVIPKTEDIQPQFTALNNREGQQVSYSLRLLTDEEMQSISALHDPANRVGADPATFVQSQSWANQKSRGNIPD